MDKIVIDGGIPLYGEIIVGGAKNSVLPLMAAAILTQDPVTILNVPELSDVATMSNLLINHGVQLSVSSGNSSHPNASRSILLNAAKITSYEAPYDIVRKMRASVLVLGPILTRFGVARVSLPGGCAFGPRPINLHLEAFKLMGAEIKLTDGYIEASAKKGLKGAEINFPLISVGATENAIMAATLADGVTVINNAAREPEICDLADMLNKMGAKISGAGTSMVVVKGVAKLNGVQHRVISDRLEAATYAVAAAITGGEIVLKNGDYSLFSNVAEELRKIGTPVEEDGDKIIVKGRARLINPLDIVTAAYPGFPTDMQAQFMSLLCLSSGVSNIREIMFENRYMHVPELNRMGANITIKGDLAEIKGIKTFYGAEVMATDLRASVSLVLAGLAAQGRTTINRVYHLDRGYEKIEQKLGQCGAKIFRVSGR